MRGNNFSAAGAIMASRANALPKPESGSCRRHRAPPREAGARKSGISLRRGCERAVDERRLVVWLLLFRLRFAQAPSPTRGEGKEARTLFTNSRRVIRLLAIEHALQGIEVALRGRRTIVKIRTADIAFGLFHHGVGQL